ncbi:MAG: copper homeostasis protein CutC [Bacteroidota bacterium]
MHHTFILEVCTFNIQSCLIAEKVGAYRIELCDNPHEGGTTPSYGTIKQVREKLNIQLYPIIRPRGGNFYYNEDELAIMKKDIEICKQLGCDGIATGVLLANGRIHIEWMKRMVEWAYPMGVTCHRAFDRTPDAFEALEDVISTGCERILTSGLKTTAQEAMSTIANLVQIAGGRITIMPGSGVRSSNIEELVHNTAAKEFHSSARVALSGNMLYQNTDLPDASFFIADEQELHKMITLGKAATG